MIDEFSVYQWLANGGYISDTRFVSAERAVARAKEIIASDSATVGLINKVIITDGDDFTVFEWRHGEGIVWPPRTPSGIPKPYSS